MRFFNYWIPYWKLNWSFTIPKTSAILLWLPGAILNTFLYSDKVLYIPILSVIHKILLFGVLILLFEWISLHAKYKNVLYLSIGIPVILVLTATDYVAYLNSFYSESASFVYLFLMIVSLLVLLQFPTTIRLLCSFVSVFLLATSHPSNMYWPLLAVPFILSAWFSNKSITLRVKLLTNLSLIGLLTILSASVVKPSSTKFNMYHSLFYGVLSFSDNPNVHLQSLEMDDAVGCINTSAFSSKGMVCMEKFQNKLSFQNTFRVIYKEPVILLRMQLFVLNKMQDVSSDYLGKFSFNDPRSQITPVITNSAEESLKIFAPQSTPLNQWAILKFKFFPKGYSLFVILIVFALWFTANLKRAGIFRDLALVGLLSTIASLTDMTIAIFGDGKHEIVKHLFLSNVLFDIALIAFINSILLFYFEFPRKASQKRNRNISG